MKHYYEIRNKGDRAEVWVYEQIGEDFWGEGLTAKNFVKEIAALDTLAIDMHINSPGGSVFDGQAMYNALQRHPARVTTYIDGVAASIASVVALAGDEVIMASNALMMVHDAWGMAGGTAEEIRAYADVLDKVGDTIVGVYTDRTGQDEDTVRQLMADETWMTAEQAVELGFADRVGKELKAAASVDFSPFNYKHPPVASTVEIEPEPEAEAAPETEPDGKPAGMSELDLLRLSLG